MVSPETAVIRPYRFVSPSISIAGVDMPRFRFRRYITGRDASHDGRREARVSPATTQNGCEHRGSPVPDGVNHVPATHRRPQQSYSTGYKLVSMTAVLCPDCGWTGDESDQIDIAGEETPQCPVCSEDVQFVD